MITYANKPTAILAARCEEVRTETSKKGNTYCLVTLSWEEGTQDRPRRVVAEANASVGACDGMQVLAMCSVQFSSYEWQGKEIRKTQLRLEGWALRPGSEQPAARPEPATAPKDHNKPDATYGDIPFALLMSLPMLAMVM